jgi:hypothetical protein
MGKKISTKSAMQCAISDMKKTLKDSEKSCLSLITRTAKSLPFSSMKENLLSLSTPNQILNY